MKTTKLLASALLFAAVFGTAQAADTETLEAMKAQNGSVKTVLMDVFTTPAGDVDRVNIIQSSGNPEMDERAVKAFPNILIRNSKPHLNTNTLLLLKPMLK